MSRWSLTRAEWTRLSSFGGAVLLLHGLAWGLFLYYSSANPALADSARSRTHSDCGTRSTLTTSPPSTTRRGSSSATESVRSASLLLLAGPLHDRVFTHNRSRPRRPGGQLEDPQLPDLRQHDRRECLGHVPLDHRRAQPARPPGRRTHLLRRQTRRLRRGTARAATARPWLHEPVLLRPARTPDHQELADVPARRHVRTASTPPPRSHSSRSLRVLPHPTSLSSPSSRYRCCSRPA
jgi:hypothetical protein